MHIYQSFSYNHLTDFCWAFWRLSFPLECTLLRSWLISWGGDSVYAVDVIHFEEMWTRVDSYSLVWCCVYNYHLFWFNNIGWFINQSAKHFFLINIVRNANATRDAWSIVFLFCKNFVIKNRMVIGRCIDPFLSFSNASPFHLSFSCFSVLLFPEAWVSHFKGLILFMQGQL